MKKYLFLLSICCLSLSSFAQLENYFALNQKSANDFPIFYAKKSKKASENINRFLQLALLQQLYENITNDSLLQQWQCTVNANNKRYLSLTFQSIYNSELTKHYAFNTATGQVLNLQDIFVPNGIAYLKRQIVKSQKQIVSAQQIPVDFKQTEKELKDDLNEFLISQDTFIMYAPNSFAVDSTGQALEYNAVTPFATQVMTKYLSQYGQAMFGVERKLKMKKMYSNLPQGLYKGKWNDKVVYLQLDAPFQKSLKGILYIEADKTIVPLEGTFKSNRFVSSTPYGQLSIVISSGNAQGNIKGTDKKMTYMTLEKL